MSNEREIKEMRSLFEDRKFARQAWKSLGQAMLLRPAQLPIVEYDKDGNPSLNSQIQDYTYSQLAKDVHSIVTGDDKPTEIEMILACQMVKARTDTAAAVFIRDTLGAKPVDESKIEAQVSNPYESLTDEELALLQEAREKKLLTGATTND